MLSQVDDLKSDLRSATPWLNLEERYIDLVEIAAEIAEENRMPLEAVQERLKALYEQYVLEWELVHTSIEQGLLD